MGSEIFVKSLAGRVSILPARGTAGHGAGLGVVELDPAFRCTLGNLLVFHGD